MPKKIPAAAATLCAALLLPPVALPRAEGWGFAFWLCAAAIGAAVAAALLEPR